jgi:hypothetical protein
MNKPSFSFNLVDVFDADGNVSYQIFTEDGDLVYDVAGDYMLATKLWLDRLSQSEREIWEDYLLECEVAEECNEEARAERVFQGAEL